MQVVEQPSQALAPVGSKSFAKVYTQFRYRNYLTIFPCISAAGDKLPLSVLIQGKTYRVFKKIREGGQNPPNLVKLYHTESGKMNEEVMLQRLQGPVLTYTEGRPAALLLDQYNSHWTTRVRELAAKLNIELIEVPSGMTSTCQPLDVAFNGPMKIIRTQIWNRKREENPFFPDTWQSAVARAVVAYYRVDRDTTRHAWLAAQLID